MIGRPVMGKAWYSNMRGGIATRTRRLRQFHPRRPATRIEYSQRCEGIHNGENGD